MALFALDHNYPAPLIDRARPYLPDVEMVFLQDIDARLPTFNDDWRVLLALHHHERAWDGMISNDARMLSQVEELAVLGYTHLTLVAPVAAGHDPIRSTGLVMAHIENIANRTTDRKPQIWRLAARPSGGDHPDRFLERLANRSGDDPMDLRKQGMPAKQDLETDPLAAPELT